MKTPTSSSRRQFLKSASLTAGSVPLAQQLLAAGPAAGRQPAGPGQFRLASPMQVVCSPPDSAPARTAGDVLARQLALRGVSTETGGGTGRYAVELRCDSRLKRDEYEVDSNEKRTILCASTVSGFLAACGDWLRSLDWSDSPPVARTFTRKYSPAVELRMQQIPGHFGNSFECLSRLEMADYLADQALAGSNGYADRYDVGEFVDPFHHHANRQSKPLSYAAELWAKKARHLLDARHLGMATCVTLNPNHVYLDQWSPALDATPGPHMVGNLICPSKPEARRFILRNYQDLFGYLQETGVTLDAIRPAPYDDGGCACAKCKPWLLTFLGLAEEISAIGREPWPAMETFMSGWWMNDADIETLRQWKASHQADWLTTFLFSTGYAITTMPDLRSQLTPIRYGTYVHAGYSGKASDKYGRNGTHSAPRRLQNLIRQYPKVGCQRFMAYTEGLESHLNSFLTARLGYDPEGDVAAEIAGYCRWFFGTNEKDTAALVNILLELESLEIARAEHWHQQLLELAPRLRLLAGRQYLWDQLLIKTELMSLDARAQVLLKGKNLKNLNRWPDAIATIAQAYEERYDHLQRKVWGTGVRRHILQDAHYVPAWLNQYWQTRHADRPGHCCGARAVGKPHKWIPIGCSSRRWFRKMNFMKTTLTLLTALLLFPLAMAAAEAPVIHYRFDSAPNGVVTNRAGAGFSGALKGSAQVTPVTEGSDSKALSLDGKTGFIEVQGAEKLHFGPEGLSIVATVRFAADEKDAATPDAGDMILFKQGEFLFGRNGDKLYFNLHDGTDWKSPVLAGPVPRGQWCHVAVIVTRQFEPAQGVNGYTVLMFLNGEPIKKVEAQNLEVPATSHPVNVGKGFGGSWFCHGELAELAVYQRPLLDDELNTLLAAEKLAKVEVRHITKPDPRYAPLLAEIRADLQQKTMGERLPFERLLAAVEQASSHVSSQTELLPYLDTVRKLSASSANPVDEFTTAHSQFTFLDNGQVGVTFFASQPKTVALCGLFDFTARRELLGQQRALWSLHYEPAKGGGAQELESVAPSVEAILSVDRAKNEAVLAWSHAATEEHPFAFAARATLRLNGPRLSLHLDVTNASADVALREVVFPAIRLRRLENGMDRLLVPRMSGVLHENPVRTFLSYDGPYPSGAAHMQFFAYYDDRGGAYVACEDGKARSKDLRAAGKDNDCELSCLWHVGGTGGNHFATSGRAAIELFRGDWFDAAQIYKRFARTADWWPASRLRADTPEWYRNMTVWFIGNANTAKAADDLLAMREYLELPIGLHWYNWNTQPFDDDYPHFTPREGFVDTVARLQSAGVYVKPYINARLWDTRDRGDEDFEYTSVALPATVKDRQGKPVMESYKERLFSPMCPTTEVWQKTMADLCGQLAGYGVAGIYLDQISAGRPRICFDATHPHAAGSGEAWLEQGYWPMLAPIRRDLKRKYPELILNSEDAAEPYMHFLDGYLPWRFLDIGRVPAYQSIYAGRIQMTSRHFSDTTYDALFPKAAEQMLYGEQVGWFGVHHLTANPAFRVFVKKLAHTRRAFLRFFNEGDMLKPAAWASPMPSITADWGYYGPRIITTPALMHCVWQVGDTIAIIVVNTTSQSVTGELMPPVKAWRLPEQVTVTDFQENDAPRTASWSTANSRQISVPGYGVAACIIGSNTDIATVTAGFSKIGKFK